MDRAGFEDWLRRYFEAWVTNDPDASLFARDARYFVDPFEGPRMRGRAEIVARWTENPQRDVRWSAEPLALEGDRGIAHWRVSFASDDAGGRTELDGVLLLSFDGDGRCTEHREWYARREVPPPVP